MAFNRLFAGAEKVGSVVAAPHSHSEVKDQVAGARRLMAALTKLWSQMSNETRFLLANEIGHTWLQAALRMKGYRTTVLVAQVMRPCKNLLGPRRSRSELRDEVVDRQSMSLRIAATNSVTVRQ